MTRPAIAKLGPFTGGINIASDPSSVADNELVDCVNLELDLDGSLITRPPITEATDNAATTTERLVMIGSAIFAGGTYIFASNVDGTFAFNGTTWTLVRAGLQSRVAIQYNNVVYIIAQTGSTNNGGYWDGTTWTTDANMPKGEAAVTYKNRLWVVPGILAPHSSAHIVSFTDIIVAGTPGLSWPSVNIIGVSVGDGQKLIDIQVYADALMLFKQDSTYVLSYDVRVTEGTLRQVSDNIGATTRRCVVSYENSTFVYHEGNVFEIANYSFNRINMKVPFELDTTVPAGTTRAEEVFLCLLGDRLILNYYNRIYVYGLLTKTWSRWESSQPLFHNFGPLQEFPALPTQSALVRYYAGSAITQYENIVVMRDGFDATTETLGATTYPIECYIVTKNYDFGDSAHFKKLAWWGVDLLATGNITGRATPVTASEVTTWGQLNLVTWASVQASPWNNPLNKASIAVAPVSTNVTDTLSAIRKFIKFLKALRFRQINFYVKVQTTGSKAQGPTRLYSLSAIVGVKEGVVKQVS